MVLGGGQAYVGVVNHTEIRCQCPHNEVRHGQTQDEVVCRCPKTREPADRCDDQRVTNTDEGHQQKVDPQEDHMVAFIWSCVQGGAVVKHPLTGEV